jgi:hypothetical protein
MASFFKFNATVEHLAEKVHNLASDALKIYLSNAAPDAALDAVKADLAEISAGNGYTAGGAAVTITASAQSGGVYKLEANDVVFTASGGPIGPFRYAVLYNDTPTSPADPLLGCWDYGASITLLDTETFTVDINAANGLIQIT